MDGCSAINLNLMWQPIINVGLAEEKARETNEERSKRQREEDEKGKGEQGRKGEVETGEARKNEGEATRRLRRSQVCSGVQRRKAAAAVTCTTADWQWKRRRDGESGASSDCSNAE